MKNEQSMIRKVIVAIGILLLPVFATYGLFLITSSGLVPKPIDFSGNFWVINPLKWTQHFSANPALFGAFSGAWIKVLIDPVANYIECGTRPLHLRQFFGTIFLAALFTALSYLQFCKNAAKIIAEEGHDPSGSLVFFAYFLVAYTAMTIALDLFTLWHALTRKRNDPRAPEA
jgi:hypothetical protein